MKDFIKKTWPVLSKWLKPTLFTVGIWAVIVFIFFVVVLPIITRHSQLVEVPDVCGISAEEAIALLAKKKFRYEKIPCSVYRPHEPLHSILEQYPRAGSAVKKNRRIYLTENYNKQAYVPMPDLMDHTIRNAYVVLKSKNIALGKIEYVEDIAHNSVLGQFHDNEEIPPGKSIQVGSKVDLLVGIHSTGGSIKVPKVTYLESLEELEMVLLSSGLRLGEVSYEDSMEHAPRTIISQTPKAGSTVPLGSAINFCIASGKSHTQQDEEPLEEAPSAEAASAEAASAE